MNEKARRIAKLIPVACALVCVAFLWRMDVRASGSDLLVDDAGLLSDEEEAELRSYLGEVSILADMDVAVITTDYTGGVSIETYVADYYDSHDYAEDCSIFAIDMGSRSWFMYGTGYASTVYTDYGIDYVWEQMYPDIAEGRYYNAFRTYGKLSVMLHDEAVSGTPYDYVEEQPVTARRRFPWVSRLIFSLIVGVIVAWRMTRSMKKQLAAPSMQAGAADYVDRGSLALTQSQDLFLYKNVSRARKAEVVNAAESHSSSSYLGGSTSHTSSGGTSYTGHGGSF